MGVGAYDGDALIGLAACSADCDSMWQIGVDVLPTYRRQGVASALTSRLALEILEHGRVPFYGAAWSNIKSVRNAIKSGFRPVWVEMTVKPAALVAEMKGWCGYACWTAMVLDFLPYKTAKAPRKRIGWIRYIVFAASLVFVTALSLAHVGHIEKIMFWAFIAGNLLYYIIGIALAFAFRDNRTFCKYICPVTVFLKPMSYFSLLRIKCDKSKCVSCGKCKQVCPMGVDITDNSRKRKNGTECILCLECVKHCPKDAL